MNLPWHIEDYDNAKSSVFIKDAAGADEGVVVNRG